MALNKILLSNGTELANVKSVSYKEVVNSGVDLRPGCVGSAQIVVDVYGSQASAVTAGEVVRYYQIDKDGNETLMGRFTAEPSIKTKNSYRFLAYDNAQKLAADFSQWLREHQADFPMTVYALVSAACTVAGVTLGSASWPLSTQTVNAFYADGITCRDILSYAAEIACRFVRCHENGAVYFDWYTATANTIAPSAGTNQYAYKQNGLTYANYTAESLARVAVHPSGEDDVAYIYPASATSGNTLHIRNNLLLTGADATFYNAVAQNVYSNLSTLFPYRPFDVRLFPMENPFRAGMIVSAVDIQGVQFPAPVMSMSVTAAAAELESTGNATLDDNGVTAKELVQLASDIVRIKKLKVDWADIDTAVINSLRANGISGTVIESDGSKGENTYKIVMSEGGLVLENWDDLNEHTTTIEVGGADAPNGIEIKQDDQPGKITFYDFGRCVVHGPVEGTNLVYSRGDTEVISQEIVIPGFITSSSKRIIMDYHTEKSMSGTYGSITNVTVTSLTGTIRGINGYVDSAQAAQSWMVGPDYSATATKISNHVVRITIVKDMGFANVTNNTPLVYWGSIGLSFS